MCLVPGPDVKLAFLPFAMKLNSRRGACAVVVWLTLAGCSKNGPDSSSAAPEAAPAAQPAPSTPEARVTTEALSAARSSLKAGNVDEAAAKLAQLQMARAAFNAQQAKDYRQALSDAYDQAIEAAQRGDPRAQAALQLLRAAAPR